MKGLKIDDIRLDRVLEPVNYLLQDGWWYAHGSGDTKPTRWGDPTLDCGPGWGIYLVSDLPEPPIKAFRACNRLQFGWFDPPPDLPPEIALMARLIDSYYWDVFFRDEWAFQTVYHRWAQAHARVHVL